ncbi:hypothetical protein [Streptomyces sp. NPDC002588]
MNTTAAHRGFAWRNTWGVTFGTSEVSGAGSRFILQLLLIAH